MKRYGRIAIDELTAKRCAVSLQRSGGGISISRITIPTENDAAAIRKSYSSDKLYRTDEMMDYIFYNIIGQLHIKLFAHDIYSDEIVLNDELIEEVKREHNLLMFEDYRRILFKALDIYEKNIMRGRLTESVGENAEIERWYKDMCNKDVGAVRRIPQRILKYVPQEDLGFKIL